MVGGGTSESNARSRILDTASELFYQHGLRAVGVDTIVARSGVAKMTLYKHFPSKDALATAVLSRRDDEWFAETAHRIEALSPQPEGRLAALFDTLEEHFRAPGFRGCPFINSALEVAEREHPISRACLEFKRRLRQMLVDLAQKAGAQDADSLADQALLLFEGACVSATMWGLAEPARRAKQAVLILLEHQRTSRS